MSEWFFVLQVIPGTVYIISVYWLSDQPLELARMGQFLVVCLLIGFVSESLGFCISSRLNIVVSTHQNILKYHEYIMGISEMNLQFLAIKFFTVSMQWRHASCIFSARKYLNKFLNCIKVLGIMFISINPHKPVVKTGCGDSVVVGILSFKVAILNVGLQNTFFFGLK